MAALKRDEEGLHREHDRLEAEKARHLKCGSASCQEGPLDLIYLVGSKLLVEVGIWGSAMCCSMSARHGPALGDPEQACRMGSTEKPNSMYL